MSLDQETLAQESLKTEAIRVDSATAKGLVETEKGVPSEDQDTAIVRAPSKERKDLEASEMPSIESGAWSDSDVGEKTTCMDGGTTFERVKAKKARVENIISTMQITPTPVMQTNGKETDSQRRKRKQFQPQPQRGDEQPEAKRKNGSKKEEKKHLQNLLQQLQQQLDVLHERYQDLYDEETHSDSGDSADLDDLNEPVDTSHAIRKSELLNGTGALHSKVPDKNIAITHDKAKQLSIYLKSRLSEVLLSAVDSVVDSIIRNPPPRVKEQPRETVSVHSHSKTPSPAPVAPGLGSHGSHSSSQSAYSSHSPVHSEQTEALSLVVPSRKAPSPSVRSSSKSPPSGSSHMISSKHHALATSVAIPNPSLHHPFARTFMPPISNGYGDHLEDYRFVSSPLLGFPGLQSQMNAMVMSENNHHHSSPRTTPPSIAESYSSFKSDCSDSSPPMAPPDLSEYSGISGTNFTATLTPTHLRKAKLMFFFCRYPSSAILRQYFPDVKFNRHNTSQMIKWFSNFREFFYIQMEKFSRQALSSGVVEPESLEVSRESELFRALNLHYNKSNEYRAPDSFLTVSTTTLREFFVAIKNGRDSEASWKKSIYKVISKLDEPIPSFFRSTNCLDLLQG